MSQNQQQFKTWDQYAEEAKRAPFELPVSKDETLIVEAPTGTSLLQFMRAYRAGDIEAMLITLVGDQWDRFEQLIGTGGYDAFNELVTDMTLFFDLAEEYELVSRDGGKRREKDPRKIRNLLKSGYRYAGEADSRT